MYNTKVHVQKYTATESVQFVELQRDLVIIKNKDYDMLHPVKVKDRDVHVQIL